MLARLAAFFRNRCGQRNHLFRICDMRRRDERGIVSWPCVKCGALFEFEYGLQAHSHGKITQDGGIRPSDRPSTPPDR